MIIFFEYWTSHFLTTNELKLKLGKSHSLSFHPNTHAFSKREMLIFIHQLYFHLIISSNFCLFYMITFTRLWIWLTFIFTPLPQSSSYSPYLGSLSLYLFVGLLVFFVNTCLIFFCACTGNDPPTTETWRLFPSLHFSLSIGFFIEQFRTKCVYCENNDNTEPAHKLFECHEWNQGRQEFLITARPMKMPE